MLFILTRCSVFLGFVESIPGGFGSNLGCCVRVESKLSVTKTTFSFDNGVPSASIVAGAEVRNQSECQTAVVSASKQRSRVSGALETCKTNNVSSARRLDRSPRFWYHCSSVAIPDTGRCTATSDSVLPFSPTLIASRTAHRGARAIRAIDAFTTHDIRHPDISLGHFLPSVLWAAAIPCILGAS